MFKRLRLYRWLVVAGLTLGCGPRVSDAIDDDCFPFERTMEAALEVESIRASVFGSEEVEIGIFNGDFEPGTQYTPGRHFHDGRTCEALFVSDLGPGVNRAVGHAEIRYGRLTWNMAFLERFASAAVLDEIPFDHFGQAMPNRAVEDPGGRFLALPPIPPGRGQEARGVGLSKHKIGCVHVGFEWTDEEQVSLPELHEVVAQAIEPLADRVCPRD